jgi:Dolichyl-phosphate-mannose-protein mannosyltransferase
MRNHRVRNALTALPVILLVAFGARLAFAWDQQRKIPRDILASVPFAQETGNIAASLAEGRGFASVFRQETGPTAWLAPVYPFLVSLVFRCFGAFTIHAFFVCVFLNILFSTAACIPVFYAGKRVATLAVGAAAAWLWAVFPNTVMVPFEWIWDTSLSALLAATLLWFTLRVGESARLRVWSLYGLLWGVSLLTNPTLGSLLPFLLAWAWVRARRQVALPSSRPALALLLVILCCAPWTLRNYFVFHRFIPLRSNFSFELWLGNNDVYDVHAPNTRTRITQYEEIRRYKQLGETQFMQGKWQKASQFIRSHPQLELQLSFRRFLATWIGLEYPLRDFLRADSVLVRVLLIINLITALGALLGIVILYRARNPFAFPLAAFPIIFPCLYYLTHASLRYRHPIDPILLLLLVIAAAVTSRGSIFSDVAQLPVAQVRFLDLRLFLNTTEIALNNLGRNTSALLP